MDGMDIMTGRFNPYNQGYFHLFFVDPLDLHFPLFLGWGSRSNWHVFDFNFSANG